MKIKKNKIKFYEENGFVKVSNFFTKHEIKLLKRFTRDIELMKPVKKKHMIYKDFYNGKLVLTRTENFIDYHKKIKKFLSKKKITKLLETITGFKSILFKDKINWKYPGSNGFEPHQDAQVWEGLYKNIKSFFSLTISIDKTTKQNGCLEIVRKKHKLGLLGNNKAAIPQKIVKSFKWEKITTLPGDIIIFTAYTPHRSKINNTNNARRMIYLTYNSLKDGNLRKEYFKNKRKSYPPNNERDENKTYKYLI